jgi:hypothetical protein
MEGQLNRNTNAGQWIYEISKYSDVKNIVDIGTWNGKGSTKCIYDAIIDSNKKGYKVFTIECARNMYEEAKINLSIPLNNFNFLYGSLVSIEELNSIDEEYKKSPWFQEDIRNIKQANNNVFNQMPETIDFLIIDGGEFSGEIEFKKLYERSKYIFLHDTNSKNKKNREFILNNSEKFKILCDDVPQVMMICKYLPNE